MRAVYYGRTLATRPREPEYLRGIASRDFVIDRCRDAGGRTLHAHGAGLSADELVKRAIDHYLRPE
ncbi:MAG: hypothetical protein EA382_16915 [Spirochaetaceae bacterium]|nr:MAG: hypothetical protein EA382_16915 [Spirochaetaceae bacterium]